MNRPPPARPRSPWAPQALPARHETVHALRGVDLVGRSGEFVAVMGPSGSGKSTLLHLLGLLDQPDEGTIVLAGTATGGLDDDALTDLRRTKLGFVFQTFELVPNLTARENVLLPAEIAGDGRAARRGSTGWPANWGSPTASTTVPTSSPAGSASGWRWRAP
jgi:ABC-type lipoprotein export system ATPase subunit